MRIKLQNDCRYFHKSNFAGVNGLLLLIYSGQDVNAKRYKTKQCYKGVLKIDSSWFEQAKKAI